MSVRHMSVPHIICCTDKSYDTDFFFFNVFIFQLSMFNCIIHSVDKEDIE